MPGGSVGEERMARSDSLDERTSLTRQIPQESVSKKKVSKEEEKQRNS